MAAKCEVCDINEVRVKDYRRSGVTRDYCEYFVCPNCFWLNDYWFFKLKNAKEGIGKKRIISRITEENWKEYLV
ncbi:MAG: hypothetical protein Kow0090_03740 [Myxococcota bacterium]